MTTIHTNEVQNTDRAFHFTHQLAPVHLDFAFFSQAPSCTFVCVFDNLYKHIFINKVSKRTKFILDVFCSTNWPSLVYIGLHARVLDDGGHVVNLTRPFFPVNELLVVRSLLPCSEEYSLSLSSPLLTVNSSSAPVI